MGDKKVPKSSTKFCCEVCYYNTSRQSQMERHMTTGKHLKMTKWLQIDDNPVIKSSAALSVIEEPRHICICGKEYKFRQGLHRHRKYCSKIN